MRALKASEVYREARELTSTYLDQQFRHLGFMTALSGGLAWASWHVSQSGSNAAGGLLALLATLGSLTAWVALHVLLRFGHTYANCLRTMAELEELGSTAEVPDGVGLRLQPAGVRLEQNEDWRGARARWEKMPRTDFQFFWCLGGWRAVLGVVGIVAWVFALRSVGQAQGAEPALTGVACGVGPLFYVVAPSCATGRRSSNTEHIIAILAAMQFGWVWWLASQEGGFLPFWACGLWLFGIYLHWGPSMNAWWTYRAAEEHRYSTVKAGSQAGPAKGCPAFWRQWLAACAALGFGVLIGRLLCMLLSRTGKP